jgi:hypothetical protein
LMPCSGTAFGAKITLGLQRMHECAACFVSIDIIGLFLLKPQ